MSWTINNLTAPDSYTPAATLTNLPNVTRITIDAVNQAIVWQLQQADQRSGLSTEGTWGPETFMLPGSKPLFRSNIRGFRFRAAILAAQLPAGGLQAQVTVEAIG
jgi:hypothetical protein